MGNAYYLETMIHVVDSTGILAASGKTVVVDALTFYSATAGHQLTLTDGADKPFADMTLSANNQTLVIRFPKPRRLSGLKVSVISGGVAYIYLAQA